MTEILFTVVEAPDGGLTASAVEHSIVTEADTRSEEHTSELQSQ